MGPDFKVLTRVFINVGASNNAKAANVGRQGHRSRHPGAGSLGGLHDLTSGLVQHLVVECLEDYPYLLPGYHS